MMNDSIKSNDQNDQAKIFEKVISAIHCSFNSNTSNQEKQNAFKYLEDFKENHPMICLTISFELLKQINNQSILHHYSLHVIESMIKSKWNLLKNDERNFMKKELFSIIKSSFLNQTFTDPIYIRNSLAKCLVELIKRDCFEKGHTTFDEIVNIIQGITQIQDTNSTQLELILLVYRFLNEELTIYAQSIQPQRRRQILNQIQKRLNDILSCLIRLSNDLLTHSNPTERLTQTCLLTMNSFLIWVEYHHFEQYEFFLCELFLKFFQLNSIKIRHASFECLLTLVNKRLARKQLQQQQQQRNKRIASSPSSALNCEQEKIFLNYLLGDQTLEMFYRLLINPTDSIDELRVIVTNDHINCLKMFGQFLLKLSNYFLQLFQQLSSKSIENNEFFHFINERTNSFFQYLLLLNQHSFHLLSLNSYQALNLFLIRQPILLSNEELCLKLIFNLKQSLHRIHFQTDSTMIVDSNENEIFRKQYIHNQQCCIYVLFEYDSEEQFFWKFFSQYRSELQKLIKSLIGLYFSETNLEMNMVCLKSILEHLFIYLESLIQRTPNKPSNALSSIYLIIEWEACYLLLDHILFILRKELSSSSTSTIKYQSLFLTSTITTRFLHAGKFLLEFTPNFSEHIHGHVLNLLSCLFFITQHDQNLAIAIIQRLLTTFQLYQEAGRNATQCEVIQSQSSNAFLYLCKNFPKKIFEYYSELFPFLCQLYKNEFQSSKTSLSMTIDEQTSPTLKLLDAGQILFYQKFLDQTIIENHQLEDFYELVKPIYEIFHASLTAQSVGEFIEYLDLCSNQIHVVRDRRRNLMLALHCLCLLLRNSKQEQPKNLQLHSKITLSLRPILYDFILKLTQFCNQLYDQQINPYYERLKPNLTYSETEKQLYLGTYESNNMFKATITTTPVSLNRSLSSSNPMLDDQHLRDYLHRLFDICYQIHGMYFAHDHELYYLKFQDENYFLTRYLQKILFENFHTLPSIRLRIVLRHCCRILVENYCSASTITQEIINELFLSFLKVFLPYIQQRLTLMWNHLLSSSQTVEQNECSEEVIEECVCVLITRDFNDIIRYFIFKTIPGQINSTKKKSKGTNERESMSEDTNGEFEQNEEWDESCGNHNNLSNRLNNSHEKMDYSDLFMYMMKMSRQDSPLALDLFNQLIQILFECLTFPDAYCINRFLPIILPLTRLYTDILDKHANRDSLIDIKYLFRCLLKALERHNENEGVNTNLMSLIGHVYELWFNHYSPQLDSVFQETIPQLNIEVLNTYKTRLNTNNKKPPITERERRDTIKNLLSPILLSPISHLKKDAVNTTNPV